MVLPTEVNHVSQKAAVRDEKQAQEDNTIATGLSVVSILIPIVVIHSQHEAPHAPLARGERVLRQADDNAWLQVT